MMKISISWAGLLLAAQDVVKALGIFIAGASVVALVVWAMWQVISWINDDWYRGFILLFLPIVMVILVGIVLDVRRTRIDRDRD